MISPTLIKAQALGLGFDLAGITKLGEVESHDHFENWLSKNFHGQMQYLARGAEKRRNTTLPLEGTKSAIVVGLNYGGTQPSGPIARYARGDDYHEIMIAKLDSLHAWIEQELGHKVRGKSYVDTGPILERDLARKAGLGWIGKNTNLVNPKIGSYFFIGSLLIDLDLEPDTPFEADRCGTCTRCLDACPTQAFVEPRVLDATKCISYLTIESRSPMPTELRAGVGELIYGCDICQEVCPWNISFSRELSTPELAPREGLMSTDIAMMLDDTDENFRKRFKKSPMKRAKRTGIARNIAIAMGNRRNASDTPVLERLAANDADPMVREAASWALEQFQSEAK
ncbi:MAG TPA: tRNA epoxyqueuosine(34) reductase QueG [Gemmatimonadaceae bacterium]|nr:tRNA epoxyqueuosine(34) reductase QueG [Gemmatimonadaceae bacterium]